MLLMLPVLTFPMKIPHRYRESERHQRGLRKKDTDTESSHEKYNRERLGAERRLQHKPYFVVK